jgi:hypothetical protein
MTLYHRWDHSWGVWQVSPAQVVEEGGWTPAEVMKLRRCLAAGRTGVTVEKHIGQTAHCLQKESRNPTRLVRQHCRQQWPQSDSERLGQTGREPAGRYTHYYGHMGTQSGSERVQLAHHGWMKRLFGAMQNSSGLKWYLASAYPLRRCMLMKALPSAQSLQRAALLHLGSLMRATGRQIAARYSWGRSVYATRRKGMLVWHSGCCRQTRQRLGPSAYQDSGWECSQARGFAVDAATLGSIVDDECALLAVVDCMSCMRSRRVVPQHKDKGLDGVINSRACAGTRRRRTDSAGGNGDTQRFCDWRRIGFLKQL